MKDHRPNHVSAVLAALAVASLALAGCFGDDGNAPESDAVTTTTNGQPNGNNGNNGNTTPPPVVDRADLLDCTRLLASHYLDRQSVQPYLPDGFTPESLIPGTAQINVAFYECRSLVASNQTLASDFSMAFVAAGASAPSEYHTPGAVDYFLLEWFTDEPLLAEFLKSGGVNVLEGQARVEPDVSQGRLIVDGSPLYQTTTASKTEWVQAGPINLKQHLMTPEGLSWAFINMTHVMRDTLPLFGFTEIHGGILSELPMASAGVMAAGTTYGIYTGYIELKR